ncbi:DUF7511 domain-containing protein [Natrinema sp. CGMCC1.2065]|uniref:DUF7511 domain-containing protein n=1 Tax=Natrinema sp. CGMCC1.2065 TaxID=3445767 RepID=UPI003F4A59DC
MSESSKRATGERESARDHGSELQHVTVEHDDIAVCTMFPQNIYEDAISTAWLTATTDSFVALEDRR